MATFDEMVKDIAERLDRVEEAAWLQGIWKPRNERQWLSRHPRARVARLEMLLGLR